jgi:rod shape-determining protein MreC
MVDAVLSRRSPVTIFIATLLLLLAGMSYQIHDPTTGRTFLGNVIFRIFSPLQSGTSYVWNGTISIFHNYFDLVGAREENTQLKKELSGLKIQMQTLSHENQENERLRQILGLQQKVAYSMIAGEVIAGDAKAAISQTITVNRGKREGVNTEMPVVTPIGIVGMTIVVAPHASQAQLITDNASSTGAMLQTNGVSGLLVGTGRDVCILRFLPMTTEVKVNDVVVTSGQDGVFPESLPIGKVSRILQESEYYKSAEVIPFQNFHALKEVVLLQATGLAPIQPQTQTQQAQTQ